MKTVIKAALSSLVLLSAVSHAGDEYNHFPSLEAPNTTVALCNLAEYNKKLQAIVKKKTQSPEDMVKVHELTYTLENAIMRLQKDLETIAVDLEKVHKASESLQSQVIKQSGAKYLTATNLILNPKGCN